MPTKPFVFSDPEILEEHSGYLVFLVRWVGSKSERFVPCLVKHADKVFWLKHKDNSSFDHFSLRQFHLKYVLITGTIEQSDRLNVVSVELAKDPFLIDS